MKAAQINAYGGPEVTTIVDDAPKPIAAAGQVVIKVHAAAVNPFDIKVREGAVRNMAELTFPAILGGDAAGVVSEIGEGVEGFSIGQEVYGQAGGLSSHGSHAEYTAIVAGQLASKPSSIDFVTAAALPLVGASAYQALVDHMSLQAGQKIMIHGGAGGIGSLAIQLAHSIGAYVATSATPADATFVSELGADEVIDYTTQDFSTILSDYDAVFDPIGGETYTKSFEILKPGGSIVSMVMPVDEDRAKQYHVTVISQFTQATTDRLTKVAALVDAAKLKVVVDKTFPLDQAADALEYQKNGHPRGKVVIAVAD